MVNKIYKQSREIRGQKKSDVHDKCLYKSKEIKKLKEKIDVIKIIKGQ